MIELFEGVPGSGKTYYAVAERFLPRIKAGRRTYMYVDGIFLDKLAVFLDMKLEDLERQITVWRTQEEVLLGLPKVDYMSFVVIDEAQTIFRAMERVDKGLCRFLETHRHHGVDILMMCQDYRQMSMSVTRLVEVTMKFRKLSFVGLSNHYQLKVRGNPDDPTEIRKAAGKYDPRIYAYYASYSAATVKELRHKQTVFMSASVVLGMGALVFALWIFLARPWSSLASPPASVNPPAPVKMLDLKQPATSKPTTPDKKQESVVMERSTPVVVIVGHGGHKGKYLYLLDDGRLMTAAQIAAKFGIAVREVTEGNKRYLIGEGVVYGSGGY